ncbi:protein of unknown function [Methylotuvimicrobium alcaliphilum 20Z]|uniref:Type IV pilus modification protein PilV n=2 Tax=Methylotuvimicrobium alcaliphilum TaxID=271065 RepID=G4ST43_META2|nr:protein of unknown function [Methylotuvimicrobium alcaliphilum 20Z]
MLRAFPVPGKIFKGVIIMNVQHRKIRGFSLIEAMIASLVVGMTMLGVARLQGITLSSSGDSRMRTHALNLAQEKIEELRTFVHQSDYSAYSGSDSDTQLGANATFTRTWTITGCANSVECKQANVAVSWQDQADTTQTVQLTSFIAEVDPVKGGVVLLAMNNTGGGGGGGGGGSPDDCTWIHGTVPNGSTVTAYLSGTVASLDDCVSETRLCTEGVLSGAYTYLSCSVDGENGDGGDDGGDTTPPEEGNDGEGEVVGGGGDFVSCSCFFRNPGQGYSLSGTNPSECTVSCCQENDTGSGNSRYFSASCPVE